MLAAGRAVERRHVPGHLGDDVAARPTSTATSYVDGVLVHVKKRAIVLVFTRRQLGDARRPSGVAVNDTRAEGDRIVVASHSVISADPAFDHAVVRNVEVTVHDDDLAVDPARRSVDPVTLNPDNTTLVIEGTATTQLTDIYDVKLSIAPAGQVVVKLTAERRPRRALGRRRLLRP